MMFGGPEATGLISIGIFIAGKVIRLVDSARRNREKCSLLKVRVEMISRLLTELQSQWTPDPVTSRLLQDLNDALDDGRTLVQSCQERRTWSLVFRTQKKARKFDALDQRITRILEMFHIANMNLIVKTNRSNGAGGAAKACALSSAAACDVAVLAASIVQEARTLRRSREEIQLLVQFVGQVANEMKQLQSSNLSWDPSTKPMVDNLKDLLQQAHNILSHHNQPHRNSPRMALDEPDRILRVAYKIEYYVQVLPVITMRQIHRYDQLI